jgi:hypothetical protein
MPASGTTGITLPNPWRQQNNALIFILFKGVQLHMECNFEWSGKIIMINE